MIWCIVYEIFSLLVLHSDTDFFTMIMSVLFLKKLDINHFWYLPMIIGMYILIPFVATALRNYDLKIITKPYYFFLFLTFICPFLIFILGIFGFDGLSVTISLGFSGGMYGIYLVSGYLVKKDYFKRFKSYHLFLGFTVSFALLVLIQLLAYKYDFKFDLWYDSIFLFLSGIALFELTSRIKNVRFYEIIMFLSKYSFAVFLIHNLFRLPLIPYFTALPFNFPLKAFLLTLTVLVLSYLLAFVISKIPNRKICIIS